MLRPRGAVRKTMRRPLLTRCARARGTSGADLEGMDDSQLEISTIVVAVDGSDEAHRALRKAAELARNYESKLVVAHAIPRRTRDEDADYRPFEEAVERAGGMLLSAAAEQVRLSPARVDTRLLRGEPAECIRNLAEEVDADLIVVGSRGLGAVGRFLLGSVSDRLLHTSGRSVLISR